MINLRRVCALCMALMVAFTTLSVSVSATDYQSRYRFGNWAYQFLKDYSGWTPNANGWGACGVSEDTLHHASTYDDIDEDGQLFNRGAVFVATCDYCGNEFHGLATEVEEIYDELTPDYSINDEGVITGFGSLFVINPTKTSLNTYEIVKTDDTHGVLRINKSSDSASSIPSCNIAYEFTVAVDCVIKFGGEFSVIYEDDLENPVNIYSYLTRLNPDTGTWPAEYPTRLNENEFAFEFNAVAGTTYRINSITVHNNAQGSSAAGDYIIQIKLPYLYYTIDSVTIDDAPIVGGGAIEYTDESGNRQYIENQFFDQSTNTYHNPVTDTSSTVESWEYDYSTRTYTGHTENGDVLITYGDENITVQEGNNIYYYYYTVPDGSGGNGGSGGSGDGSDDDGDSIWDKLGNLFGNLVGGLIDLISGVISGLLDSLIELVGVTLDKLGSIVDLFGSFGDALRSLWSWLPEDIVTILAAGVSVVVFASVIKLFI